MDEGWSLRNDLDAVLDASQEVFAALRGAQLFITGGTGFIGCWILESLLHANRVGGYGIRATVLSRDPARFATKRPHLVDPAFVTLLQGDVNSFHAEGHYSHLIHAATDASADLNENNPRLMFDTVLQGTRRALDFALELEIPRVLYFSSGAVYGRQPWDVHNVPEEWSGAPDCTNPVNAYAEGKRAAEMLCGIYGKQFGLQISIARIFALLGPYLSLDIHFAAGNFIRDAMAGRKIIVKGNGLPVRSYLYAGDLTVMLWHLLLRGPAGKAYNVGSDEGISIADLAAKTAALIGTSGFEVLGQDDKGWNPGRYVPDTSLIQRDLGLSRTVSLDDSIRRTALWQGWKPWH